MSTAEERTNATSSTDAPFHPFHPQHFSHPYERLKQARERCPVGPFTTEMRPDVPFYFLAQDADVRAAFHSPDLSNHGNFELAKDYPSVITQMDGEEHKHLRTILEQSFNARIFKEARPFIVHKTSELLDAMLQQENHQADFMDAFAQRLPTAVITYLMGIPEADAERIRAWNVVLNSAIPGPFYDTDAWKHFEGYILGLLAGYRMAEQAPDTIISRLFKTDLSQDEILMTIFQLLIAGADTSTMLLGNLLWELLRVPARWEIVKADRKLIIPAVEEALRLHPPLNWVMRSCPTSVTIHRETLPAGSRLVISMTSANRDEARWGATAEDFEIGRPNVANHMTFGAGRHFCLGAQLARLQVSVALEMMLEHIPTLSLAKGYQYDPLAGAMIHGPGRLDVIW